MTDWRPARLVAVAFAALTLACGLALEAGYRWPSAVSDVLLAPGWIACSAVFRASAPCISAPALAREPVLVLGASLGWTLLLIAGRWVARFLARCVRGPEAARARRSLGASLLLYLLFWAMTMLLGVPQVRRTALVTTRQAASRARPAVRPPVRTSRRELDRPHSALTIPWYYVDVAALAPFIIRIDHGYQAGSLWGSGGRDWYLWFLGLHVRLVQTWWWVS